MTATAVGKPPACGGRRHFSWPDAPVQAWLQDLASLDHDTRAALLAPFPDLLPDAAPARRLAHAVLRHWLGELLSCPASDIALTRAAHGKPRLDHPGFTFNYAHSGSWLLLAWSRSTDALGADLEVLDREQAWEALTRRYFHANEQTAWRSAPASAQAAGWLRLWTRKEAVVKAHGLGLRLRLDTLDTTGDAVQHPELGDWRLLSQHEDAVVFSLAWPG